MKIINEGKRKVITDPIEYLMLADRYLRSEENEGKIKIQIKTGT